MREVVLPSGAKLEVRLAPFKDSKALYQAILEELRSIEVDLSGNLEADLVKNFFCVGFSSKKIESTLLKCMEKSTYNGLKITDETFESADSRQDYMKVCVEVAKENVEPFMKSLFAEYSLTVGSYLSDLSSRQVTTQS